LPPHSLTAALLVLAQVVLIDITLAGDNAVMIGMAVRTLKGRERRIALAVGVTGSAILRLGLALIAVRLLSIVGLTLAGGLLLAWVCWKMFRELRGSGHEENASPAGTLRAAIIRIMIADLSMSLDNVLAVAGAAMEHPAILIAGLVISVLLMGIAANLVARLLERYRWIAWFGLLIVVAVALELIWKGGGEVWHHLPTSLTTQFQTQGQS